MALFNTIYIQKITDKLRAQGRVISETGSTLALRGRMKCGLIAGAAVAGCGQTLGSTVWTSFVQRQVPEGLYGRVSSISTLAQLAPVPLTALVAGAVAGHTGVRPGLAVCAVVTVGAAGTPLCLRIRALTAANLAAARQFHARKGTGAALLE